ncbi:DUF937 domain-containing protein [Imbroritus primus]|uniref:DUF937 domain-containing protein n=1 Tax=Imbroritus primus TaxID=3058603 RepID=A0ACD3SLF1_9BURK|nr:DUF937 domain-containing protein [Burkholderiaceae bacterium PBA]
MQITDLLGQIGGLQSMANELGVDESEVARGADALLPAILGGVKKQAQAQPGGLEAVLGMLGQAGGGGLLEQVLGAQPTDVSSGNDILGQIFGSKDVSRTVAESAAAQSGLDSSLLKKMLPMLAMLVMGYMSRQRGGTADETAAQGGGLGDLFGGVLGGGAGGLGGGLGSVLGGMLGGGAGQAQAGGAGALGGLGSMLDLNGDGNALDDILRMAGKAMR